MAGYSVTYSVVDNATKQIDAINRRITAMRAPMERMSKQLSRFVDVSGLNTIAKGFASIGRAAGSVLRTLVEIVPVMGTLTGAATLAGMAKLVGIYADWSQHLTMTADNLGMTTQQLQQFEDATRLAGGRASDMDDALKALYKTQSDFARNQASPAQIGWLNKLSIDLHDATGNLRSMSDLMPEVVQKIAAIQNPADRAAASAALLGDANSTLVETFRRSHQSFGQWMTDASRYTELSDKQKDQLQAFSEAQGRIATAFDHLGQQISATLAANFTPLINKLADFVEKNSPEIIAAVDRISKKFADWLAGVDWTKVQSGIDSVIQSLVWVTNHLDEIKTAAEAIAALFAAKWAVGIVASIAQVTTALGSVAAGAAGGVGSVAGGVGLLGALGAVASLAAGLAALAAVYHFNKQGQAEIKAGAAKEGFTQYNEDDQSFTNPQTGEKRTWVEQMQQQGKAPADYTKEGYSPTQKAIGDWYRSHAPTWMGGTPAAPLGLPQPEPGKTPASVELPGDYSWGDYGTRANNPGNMNYASWQNAAGRYTYTDPQTGGAHTMAVYNTMEEGVADTYKLLQRNQEKYGKSVAGALHGWAENSYIPSLAKDLGLDPNAEFDISKADPQVVERMMEAQFKREGRRGSHTATGAQIMGGIALARGDAPPANVPPTQVASGNVNVDITHKNAPANTAITASASGKGVSVSPPRVEYQEFATI